MAEDKETVGINLRIPQLSHRIADGFTDGVRDFGNGIIELADDFADKTKTLGKKLKKGFSITAGAPLQSDTDTEDEEERAGCAFPPYHPPAIDHRKAKLDALLRLIIALSTLGTESANALLQLLAVKAYKLICPTAKILIEGDCQKSLISCCKDVLNNEDDSEVAEQIAALLEMCTGAKVV